MLEVDQELQTVTQALADTHGELLEIRAAVVYVILRDAGKLRKRAEKIANRSRCTVQGSSWQESGERVCHVCCQRANGCGIAIRKRAQVLGGKRCQTLTCRKMHGMIAGIS